MRIALIAGEASGDALGGALIRALRACEPALDIEAVAGPAMRAAGCRELASTQSLAVMGVTEVLRHLPRLLALRARLLRHWRACPPDVLVGIDAPDFNLGVEARLRARGVRTVHYVSPSVWAWRARRMRAIARAADCVLTLLPFESAHYARAGVASRYVGHPLAATLPAMPDSAPARAALGLPGTAPVVALLPGSRVNEWSRLAPVFALTARWLARRRPDCRFVLPLAQPQARGAVAAAFAGSGMPPCLLLEGQAHAAMAAADVVLTASGTATLEAMLIGRPMVVAYRLAPLTYWLARRLVRVPHVALPNLLAGREVVPEFLQHAATPQALGQAVLERLDPACHAAQRSQLLALRPAGPADPALAAAQAVLAVARGGQP